MEFLIRLFKNEKKQNNEIDYFILYGIKEF